MWSKNIWNLFSVTSKHDLNFIVHYYFFQQEVHGKSGTVLSKRKIKSKSSVPSTELEWFIAREDCRAKINEARLDANELSQQNENCIYQCAIRSFRVTNSDGTLSKDKFMKKLEKFSKVKLGNYIRACSDRDTKNDRTCDYGNCLLENNFDLDLKEELTLKKFIDDKVNSTNSRKHYWKCMRKYGYTKHSDFVHDNLQTGCLFSCSMQLLNLTDEDGKLDNEKIMAFNKKLSAEKLDSFSSTCEKIVKSEVGTAKYACHFANCLKNNFFFVDLYELNDFQDTLMNMLTTIQ